MSPALCGSAQTNMPQIGRFVTLTASDTTDTAGHVQLHILDGALLATAYTMRIVPPASSTFGVVYKHAVTPGAQTPRRSSS